MVLLYKLRSSTSIQLWHAIVYEDEEVAAEADWAYRVHALLIFCFSK